MVDVKRRHEELAALQAEIAELKASRDRLRAWVLLDPQYHDALIDGDIESSDLWDADPAPDTEREAIRAQIEREALEKLLEQARREMVDDPGMKDTVVWISSRLVAWQGQVIPSTQVPGDHCRED